MVPLSARGNRSSSANSRERVHKRIVREQHSYPESSEKQPTRIASNSLVADAALCRIKITNKSQRAHQQFFSKEENVRSGKHSTENIKRSLALPLENLVQTQQHHLEIAQQKINKLMQQVAELNMIRTPRLSSTGDQSIRFKSKRRKSRRQRRNEISE